MLHYLSFHNSSKHVPQLPSDSKKIPRPWVETSYKAYEGSPQFVLPRRGSEFLSEKMAALLRGRMTSRKFNRYVDLPTAAIDGVLEFACGETESYISDGVKKRRTYPSAGALYPVEVYLVLRAVGETLPQGLCHYRPDTHALELLAENVDQEKLKRMIYYPFATEAPVIIFLTGRPDNVVSKYADRGYRFLLQESGIVARNIELAANAFGLGVALVGGTDDNETENFLDIDGTNELHLLTLAIG